MSLGGYIRRKAFWKNNPELLERYNEIREIFTFNENTCKIVEDKKIRLFEHASSTTDFYATYVNATCIEDFPVINKMIVIENREAMFSKTYRGQKLHRMCTSGSTGIPFEIEQDKNKRMNVLAEIKAFNDSANYPSHEKMLFLFGAARGDKSFSKKQQFKENIYRIPVAVNDDETMEKVSKFISQSKPWAIHASASSFPPLIKFLKTHSYYTGSVKTIITGGEMVPIELRKELENVFFNSKVYVKYSNEEMGIFGQDSGVNTPYILNWGSYWFEILKLDSDEPCEYGELGRIVVTDLNNYAVPLIRYDTGDIGSLVTLNDSTWPVLVNLSGKIRDLIYDTKGNSISGMTITNIFKHVKNVKMYQLVQNTQFDYQYVVVPVDGKRCSNEDLMLNELKELLGKDANIEIVYSDDVVTSASGKRRYTINNYKKS